jgi:phosphoglycolate phosphatase-like HAD superfamily hydrolase
MKLLVTDFDGVVCDSVSECLLAAENAWGQLQTSYEAQRIFDIDAIPTNRQAKFRKLRPYLRGAEDFIPLFLAVERDLEVESQADFDLLRRRLQHQLPQYQQAFYAERDFLRQHHRRLWLQLNPLFSEVGRALATHSSFEHIFILTTKRQPDVVDILEYHGIDFPFEQIHSVKSDGKMKRLQQIMQSAGAAPAETGYIEDQIDYLLSAAPLGVNVRLADWGYVSAEQRRNAKEQGIPSIDQAAMAALFQNLG